MRVEWKDKEDERVKQKKKGVVESKMEKED